MPAPRRPYVALDTLWPHDPLGKALRERLGPEALGVWAGLLTWQKRSGLPDNKGNSYVLFTTDSDFWSNTIGTPDPRFDFTPADLLHVTGALRHTRKSKYGDATKVTWTRFQDHNKWPGTRQGRSQTRSSRTVSTAPQPRREEEVEVDIEKEGEVASDPARLQEEGPTDAQILNEAELKAQERIAEGSFRGSVAALAPKIAREDRPELEQRLRRKQLKTTPVDPASASIVNGLATELAAWEGDRPTPCGRDHEDPLGLGWCTVCGHATE